MDLPLINYLPSLRSRIGEVIHPLRDAQGYILLTKGSGEEVWGRGSTQFLAEKCIDVSKPEW
jgi:DNA excision repair protein ERCC-3